MNIIGVMRWLAISIASLIVIAVAVFLILAYPTIGEISRMSERGALQLNARKEAMILETHSTRSLSVTVFREAFMKLHDGAWYKLRKIPESLTIVYLADFWFTESEWAAAYCDSNDCLDVWAHIAYQSTFDELGDAKARCAMALSKSSGFFGRCDELIKVESDE